MLQDWISAIEDWVPMLAESLWVYPALMLFATIDGFFPPIPSESVVIGLASLSVSHGEPNLGLIALAGAIGAFTGDQIAYMIGSRVDVHALRLFRTPRGRRALAWAEHALAHRGSSFILAARYIPVGRVAVNMTAGALGYPRKRFVGLTALAAVTWALYGTVVGAGAGLWLENHPVIAVVAGVVVGTAAGIAIDWVLRRWTRFGRTRAPEAGAGEPGQAERSEQVDADEDGAARAGTPAAAPARAEGAPAPRVGAPARGGLPVPGGRPVAGGRPVPRGARPGPAGCGPGRSPARARPPPDVGRARRHAPRHVPGHGPATIRRRSLTIRSLRGPSSGGPPTLDPGHDGVAPDDARCGPRPAWRPGT